VFIPCYLLRSRSVDVCFQRSFLWVEKAILRLSAPGISKRVWPPAVEARAFAFAAAVAWERSGMQAVLQ
jgi:hypothetical protein